MNIKEATQALEDILEHHWRNPTTTRETTKIALKDLIEKERASAVKELVERVKPLLNTVTSQETLQIIANEYLKTIEPKEEKPQEFRVPSYGEADYEEY